MLLGKLKDPGIGQIRAHFKGVCFKKKKEEEEALSLLFIQSTNIYSAHQIPNAILDAQDITSPSQFGLVIERRPVD